MAIEFNVKAVDATTGQLITAPLVIRIDAGLSGTVRNTNPANFYAGPPLPHPWIGDVEVIAAGYAPWSTGANPQRALSDRTVEVLASLTPFKNPFRAAPRLWAANMCGIRLSYLPPIPGGAADASLFMTWLDHRYDPTVRTQARRDYLKRYTHYLMSWPDAQDDGLSPSQFAASCREVIDLGGYPCVMLSAKPTSAATIRDISGTLANILLVLPTLIAASVPLYCIGWELSLWLSPSDVQFLINQIMQLVTPRARLYVHFQQGYGSFQQPGAFFADFWNLNVGKLTGLLHQKLLRQTRDQYRYDSGGLWDILTRFAGNYGVAPDSGFGHPFDCVALEITAQTQFNGSTSEADGDALGRWAITTPPANGPAGLVGDMGSGNGA